MFHAFARCFAHGLSIQQDLGIFSSPQVYIEGRAQNQMSSDKAYILSLIFLHISRVFFNFSHIFFHISHIFHPGIFSSLRAYILGERSEIFQVPESIQETARNFPESQSLYREETAEFVQVPLVIRRCRIFLSRRSYCFIFSKYLFTPSTYFFIFFTLSFINFQLISSLMQEESSEFFRIPRRLCREKGRDFSKSHGLSLEYESVNNNC